MPPVADGSGREAAVDQVVGKIRSLIRARRLTIGDALPSEVDLAHMFGASRNTTREAMRVLRAYGIVESRPKIGAVITDRRSAAMMDAFSFALDISADTFRDVQGFRRLIEINLADELISRFQPDDISKITEINEAMNRAEDGPEAARLDYLFHKSLIDHAGNQTLSEVYQILGPVLRRLMEAGKTMRRAFEGAYKEHGSIIAALRDKDRLAYTYHMTRHLDAGLEFIASASREGSSSPAEAGSCGVRVR